MSEPKQNHIKTDSPKNLASDNPSNIHSQNDKIIKKVINLHYIIYSLNHIMK